MNATDPSTHIHTHQALRVVGERGPEERAEALRRVEGGDGGDRPAVRRQQLDAWLEMAAG